MIINNEWNASKLQVQYRFNRVRDELTFSASDNDDAPDEPILFQMECYMIINNELNVTKLQVHCKFNRVRDEFTFSASDNDDAPDEQIFFKKEYEKWWNKIILPK